MADFHQTSPLTTIHDLHLLSDEARRQDLAQWSDRSPVSLVIPTLFSDLDSPAFQNIIDELAQVQYVREVIIGVDRADQQQFTKALRLLDRLPQHHRLLWNDGPAMREFEAQLATEGMAPTGLGKGRNVWLCLGYFLGSARGSTVVMHDSDIVDYSRSMLDRLVYPVLHPDLGIEAAKGFYARSDQHRLNGRVTRLLMAPMIEGLRHLRDIGPALEYLDFLAALRYALSGEHAMTADVARSIRLPPAWSLELEFLAGFYNDPGAQAACQVEISDRYDHKHQELSPANGGGLVAMAAEIVAAVSRQLRTLGVVLNNKSVESLVGFYRVNGAQMIEAYRRDALANGLEFDIDAERATLDLFAQVLATAGTTQAPKVCSSWHDVQLQMPDALERLAKIVEADNA